MTYKYYGVADAFLGVFIFVAIILLIIVVAHALFGPSKSRTYRKMMTDLFVAGRIKQLAKEKEIDIAEEYESFKKWLKKERIVNEELDTTIERDLQEKLSEDNKELYQLK